MNNDKSIFIFHKKTLLACLSAVILFAIYQFYPEINGIIAWGAMIILRSSMWAFAAVPWIVAGALSAAIAIVYYLAGVRSYILAATFGFSISYLAVSLLTTILEMTRFIEVIIGIVLAYILFVGCVWLTSKFNLSKKLAVVVGAVFLGLVLFLTPLITQPIDAHRATTEINDTFNQAVKKINFNPYYPTYSSSVYPASQPQLNGYEGSEYSNETVTFLLGKAQVKQGGHLENQDKIMDFTHNCSIFRIWSTMEDSAGFNQREIEQSLDSPQKCNLIQTTPTGKKVYFNDDGQWTRFYVLLDKTNFIIDFDNINDREYDPSTRDEVLKIIDSLQPLDTSKLEKGNSFGHGFSS